MRQFIVLGAASIALVVAATAPNAQAGTVAHWSFDSGTLTTDGSGNITAAGDSTGNHNATVGNGTFLATDSVTGQFGQGLRFNGDNNLQFANLTELMQSSGAPSYTVSLWIQWLSATAPGGGTPFQTLGDWGHGDAGTPNETSRFTYAFGPNEDDRIRGQARHESASGSGSDIFAENSDLADPLAVNDGSWHMLTWTFDTTSGTLNAYFDGNLVETSISDADSFQLADSTSSIGTFGLKGDSATFLNGDVHLDEVHVFDQVANAAEVQSLFVNNVIPEPTSLALLSLGGLGLLRRRGRTQ